MPKKSASNRSTPSRKPRDGRIPRSRRAWASHRDEELYNLSTRREAVSERRPPKFAREPADAGDRDRLTTRDPPDGDRRRSSRRGSPGGNAPVRDCQSNQTSVGFSLRPSHPRFGREPHGLMSRCRNRRAISGVEFVRPIPSGPATFAANHAAIVSREGEPASASASRDRTNRLNAASRRVLPRPLGRT
jgi:hypothetical protein